MKWDYASKTLPKNGEKLCGDAVFARAGGGCALFALLDGLGHGAGASQVAQRGLSLLASLPLRIDAVSALTALDHELHGTRGAAATICSIDGVQLQIAGIGNVACRALGAPVSFVPTPGIVGLERPVRAPLQGRFTSGQRLVLHSDGVSHRFDLRSLFGMTPEAACEWILLHHRHQHDDSGVLIIDARADASPTPGDRA